MEIQSIIPKTLINIYLRMRLTRNTVIPEQCGTYQKKSLNIKTFIALTGVVIVLVFLSMNYYKDTTFNQKINSLAGRYSIYKWQYTFQDYKRQFPLADVYEALDWITFQSLIHDNYYNGVSSGGIWYDKESRIIWFTCFKVKLSGPTEWITWFYSEG